MLDLILAFIPLALAPALISAAASVGGGVMSAMGQSSANAANVAAQQQANQQSLQAQYHANELNQQMTDEGRQFAMLQQDLTQRFNAQEADKFRTFSSSEATTARNVQNEFQERMASTQYQRAMADMAKAGLNPMLAYQQGGNAAPSGSSAMATGSAASASPVSGPGFPGAGATTLRAPVVHNTQDQIGRALGNVVNTAIESLKGAAEVDLVKQHEKESSERVRKSGYETTKMDAETSRVNREVEKVSAETDLIKQSNLNAVLTNVKAAAELKDIATYGTHYTPNILERIGRLIQGTITEDLNKIQIQRKD